MGPLVPEIISDEFNFIVAFLIGLLFGFILEQAGFSSTKKLVGLFYGYDFTVLKVFFTAGVTAMSGVLLLTHLGLLDMRMVYINPTFVRSALVGGVIMGGGFIMGGFCPGTSVCAAAVGKLDAWAFIGGSLIGIFAFTESYPFIKEFYLADSMGFLTIYDQLGITKEVFGFLLTAVAIAAFYFTGKIEDRVNGLKATTERPRAMRYAMAAVVPFVLVTIVSFTPNKKTYLYNKAERNIEKEAGDYQEIDIDHLAEELASKYHEFNVIDVRNGGDFKEFSIPTSISVPLDSLTMKEYRHLLNQPYKINVFVGSNLKQVQKAWHLAEMEGYANNLILTEPVQLFESMYFKAKMPGPNASKFEKDSYRFRIRIGTTLKEIEQKLKSTQQPVKREIKRVTGGCA